MKREKDKETDEKLKHLSTAFRDSYKNSSPAKEERNEKKIENRTVCVFEREKERENHREGNQEAATELLADGAKTRITDWGTV